MTIYNSTNNISEDYTFIINIDEILYTEQELINLELDIYQCDDPELDELVWHTTNNITSIYNTLKEDNDLSSIGLLDTDIDCKDIFSAIINNEVSTHTYIGLQNNDRTNLPTFGENQYFILLAKEEDNLFLCIPIKHYGLYNNIRIVDINTFEPADFEYLSAKQAQNLIYSLISKMEILEFVETLPPKSSARTNCVYLLTETPSDPTDLVDDGLNLNFGLYTYSKTINDYKKLDTLTFNIKNFVKKTDIINNLTSTVIDAPLSAKQGKILNDNKQDILISGTNIKTINSQSLLGNGDITISDGIELITTTNTSDEQLTAVSTTLSEVKKGTMILLKVINPFNRISADCDLTLTLKNGEVLSRKLINHPDSPTSILHSEIVPPNTIFLMRYNGSRWDIIDQYNLATQSFRGFMSAEDKTKLDNTYTKAEVDTLIGSGGSVNIRTSSTGFSSTLTDTEVPSEKLIKEYVDNTIGSIQNFIHS